MTEFHPLQRISLSSETSENVTVRNVQQHGRANNLEQKMTELPPRQRINLSSEAQQVKQVWSTGPVNVLLNFFATQLFDGLATSPIRC